MISSLFEQVTEQLVGNWETVTMVTTILLLVLINGMFIRRLGNTILNTVRALNLDTFWYKVDAGFPYHGGDLVAQVLQQHGIKEVFTLCGGHVSPVLTGCQKAGITVIDTRHEASAAFAADASSRITGKPGVCVVTAGPGLTNTVTAVKNAQMAETPLIVIGGTVPTLLKGRGALQDIDQLSVFSTLCKESISVNRVRDLQSCVTRALHVAASGVPGPVLLELPVDVLYPYPLVRSMAGIKKDPKGLSQKVVNWYVSNGVDAIFAGANAEHVIPKDVAVTSPKSGDIATFSKLLSDCKRPVAVLGSQATLPGNQVDDLVKSLPQLGVPCYLGGMCRGLLGAHHPLFYRQRRRNALKNADLIILAGAVCDFRLDYGRSMNTRAKIIAINRGSEQLNKNRGLFWKAALTIQADVSTTLSQVAASSRTSDSWSEWKSALAASEKDAELEMMRESETQLEGGANPVQLFKILDECLPENGILIGDGGDFVGTASRILRPRKPLSWLDPGAYGTLGVGGGFALGVKAVKPDSEIWVIWGDGSSGYSIAEVDSAVRHRLPFIALIGNDGCWGQIERDQKTMLGSDVGCMLAKTNYHIVAEGYGAKGLVIPEGASADDIRSTLKEAQSLHAQGNVVVINAILGKSKFREGSISL